MIQSDYNESVKSRFDDIKRDGPNIYTGLLENIDNSIDWGEATEIEIIHNRESITIKDNGKNGFGSIEALERFFIIGQINEENVTESTIGKYGKGGYKATISMGNRVEITTYFDGNEYNYGTNFIEMEEKNIMEPTMKLEVKKNESGEIGTEIKILLRHEIGLIYNSNDAKRHFIRAYHNYGRSIKFSLKSGKEIIEFNPISSCPYEKTQYENTYYVYYQKEDNRFIHKSTELEDEDVIMEIQQFVLQDKITRNPLLSNRKPGIDFYRCGRMCNTRYPIFNIGEVGTLLTKGTMRGMRCHIICKFNDKQITDLTSMDDYVGVTTVKDIYEDDRMDPSLIEILEEISKKTSEKYEDIIKEQREGFKQHIEGINKTLRNMKKMEDDILLEDNYNLDHVFKRIINWMNFQIYYFDTDLLEFKYCTSKEEKKLFVNSGDGTKFTKASQIYKYMAYNIIPLIGDLQQKKDKLRKKEIEIQIFMKENKLPREEAKIQYEKHLRKIKDMIEVKERKKHLEVLLTNAQSNHKSKNYDEAIRLYEEYIEINDGECNETTEKIGKIKEEQIIHLREEIDNEIENKNYDKAFDYTEEIIEVDNNLMEEMRKLQDKINTFKFVNELENAEENRKNEKYSASIKIYQDILEEFEPEPNRKIQIETMIKDIKGLQIKSYEEKAKETISVNDFKKAKKYSEYIRKIDPEKGDEINKLIEKNEKTHEEKMKSITKKDITNIYQIIMSNCTTDKEIQKFFKVLEYYHNNP